MESQDEIKLNDFVCEPMDEWFLAVQIDTLRFFFSFFLFFFCWINLLCGLLFFFSLVIFDFQISLRIFVEVFPLKILHRIFIALILDRLDFN